VCVKVVKFVPNYRITKLYPSHNITEFHFLAVDTLLNINLFLIIKLSVFVRKFPGVDVSK
jgi:hypothetical protein